MYDQGITHQEKKETKVREKTFRRWRGVEGGIKRQTEGRPTECALSSTLDSGKSLEINT